MPESIVSPFLGQHVTVKTGELTVQGRLVAVDPGLHGAIGNVILKQGETLTLVRGDHVQVIAAVSPLDDVFPGVTPIVTPIWKLRI